MTPRPVLLLVSVASALGIACAADRDTWPPEVLKLKPPFDVAAPKAPPSSLDGANLRDPVVARKWMKSVDDVAKRNRIDDAISIRHWFIAGVADAWGRAGLAALYAFKGDKLGAIYWLQRAAVEEGMPMEDFDGYPVLAKFKDEPEWPALKEFITAASEAWTKSAFRRDVLLTPKGSQPGKAVPVIVGMHGHRGGPGTFFRDEKALQKMCDELGIAFLSISGPIVFGPHSFGWPLDLNVDLRRVEEAFALAKERVTPDPKRLMLLGYSAGGQVGLEMAALGPEHFLGAMSVCPGRGTNDRLRGVLKAGTLPGRRFMIINGDQEHPDILHVGKEDTEVLELAGAKVLHITVPGMAHQLPENFPKLLAEWAKLVVEMDGKP